MESLKDLTEQENELLVLSEIFSKEQFVKKNSVSGKLIISINFHKDFRFVTSIRSLSHLPPLELKFTFPTDYPSKSLPSFSIHCLWMSEILLDSIKKKCIELWIPTEVIIFTWFTFLQNDLPELYNNFLDYKEYILSNDDIFSELISFDTQECSRLREKKHFICLICLSNKLGVETFDFPKCFHAYCYDCIRKYFESEITKGNVDKFKCPQLDCDEKASSKETLASLYEEKYIVELLSKGLEWLRCPLPHCKAFATIDEELFMGNCTICRFVFCSKCFRSYHCIRNCEIRAKEDAQLAEIYLSASSKEKIRIEKQYGKILQSKVEEYLSNKYIQENTMKCPQCSIPVQKIEGCNRMTCILCQINFCYLCGNKLSKTKYARHYEDIKLNCFNQFYDYREENTEEGVT